MTTAQEIGWVGDDAALARLVSALEATSIAAVDTEFVREKTYYPQLCLIQIGTGEQVACVDCLAGLNLEPLFARLFDASFTWVLHSARQDLEVVFQLAGRMPPRLIDTQVAAAFTGYPPQVGLEGLLKRALDVELGEASHARTGAGGRCPRRRCATRSTTSATCSRRGTSSTRSSSASAVASGSRKTALACSPSSPSRTRRRSGRRSKACTASRSRRSARRSRSCGGAEAAAQKSDRPRRWLLADEPLLALAAALPSDAGTLLKIAQSKFIARSAPAMLAAIASSRTDEDCRRIRAPTPPKPCPTKRSSKSLQERVRDQASKLGVEPEILATKRDLVGVALGSPPPHLRSGWRARELACILAP